MAFRNLSRRAFLARLGIGTAAAGAVAIACGSGESANQKAAAYQKYQQDHAYPNTAPAPAAAASMEHGTMAQAAPQQQGMSAADMDRMHEAGVKAFPAKTKGLGGQPLAYTMDGDTKVFTLTAQKVTWEFKPDDVKDAYAYNGTLPGPEIRVIANVKGDQASRERARKS